MVCRLTIIALLVAAIGLAGCGETDPGSASNSAPSSSANTSESTDTSAWETARQSQEDPSAVKSADDIAGNCVMDTGSGAKICGTAAIDYCAGGLAPSEAQYACEVILTDALTPKK